MAWSWLRPFRQLLMPRPIYAEPPRRDMLAYVAKAAPASRQLEDPFGALYADGLALEPPLPPEQLLRLTEECPIHAAAIAAKVDDAVGRGWTLVGEQAPERDQVEQLLERLCPLDSWQDLLEAAAWDLEAIGWAAWEVVRARGRIVALYVIPAHTLRATREPGRFVQLRNGQTQTFWLFGQTPERDAPECIVFRRYHPRTRAYGIPRWVSAIPVIAELTAIREYNVSWYASGGTVDRVVHVRATAGAEAQRIAGELRQGLADAAGRGHVTLFSWGDAASGVDVLPLSPVAGRREGQFLARREELHNELLMAHRVPAYRIGWARLGSLGGSAAREMLEAYKLGEVEPLQRILETTLRRTLFGPQGLALQGIWRLEDTSWSETELNLDIATRAIERGLLTPNEARALLGYSPADEPDLDRYYLAQTLQPLGTQPEAKAALDVIAELRAALERAVAPDVLASETTNGAG